MPLASGELVTLVEALIDESVPEEERGAYWHLVKGIGHQAAALRALETGKAACR